MTLVVGVDGGGTHTRAVIVDESGRELGRAESAGGVVSARVSGPAAQSVAEAVQAAATQAGVTLPLDAMWAGLAGAGSRASSEAATKQLEGMGLVRRVVVGTDVEAAYHDAFGVGPGILLIAGTGSIAWARHPTAGVIRVGGWGERFGDEGSGYAIGLGALRAVSQAEDGRGPATALRDSIMEHLSLTGREDLVAWMAGASKGDVAALVPLVSRAAAQGDAIAAKVLATAAEDLTAHLKAVLQQAGPWPEELGLVLWGGVLGEGGPLREAVAAAAADYSVRVLEGDVDPAMGAAKMALATVSETGQGA